MAPGLDPSRQLDDPRLEGGEWLFRRADQVFGPVDSRALAAMLYRGELEATSPVSTGDGVWRPVVEVPIFHVHARKAEAAQQVEREVTGARLLRERHHRRRTLALVAGAVLLVLGAGGAAFLVASGGPETSPLLEDFGAGISLASAARVEASRAEPGDELVEVPMDAPAGAAPARRAPASARSPDASARRPSGDVEGGDLVDAPRYDAAKIQAVVAREQRTLATCFRAEAERSPDFRGDVPLEFAVGNDGRVAALWIDEPRFRAGALRDCLQGALARWRFDPFPGQRPTVSLAFRIGR
jgi:hypothetical protein